MYSTALRGSRSLASGLDPKVGDRRGGDDGLEAAVAGDRRPNP